MPVAAGFLVGLFVGEGRLVRHGGGKAGVLAHGVVHAEAGAHHGLLNLRHAPGQAYARLEGLVPRKDERTGQPVHRRPSARSRW